MEASPSLTVHSERRSPARNVLDLFAVSVLLLFLELACMRWFPAHVLFLTFFTNVILLACFLGMSVGCLTAGRSRNYMVWTPLLLLAALCAAHWTNQARMKYGTAFDAGNQLSPQLVYFGAEGPMQDVARFVIPIEAVNGFFFVIIALAMIGPGQELGRALGRVPNRVVAYTVNILGSMAGIAAFAFCSWNELSPWWWFLPIVVGLAYFAWPYLHLYKYRLAAGGSVAAVLAALVLAASASSRPDRYHGATVAEHFWSPYYRVDHNHGSGIIVVNLIGHQQMVSREQVSPAYALPHFLNRDAGGPPFRDVLIIGAGSGNDVSRALAWGADHVDAVEIDPVIQRLGQQEHPDHPYQDPRVTVHLDDGRNFLHTTERHYDLVIYALVDSLVLHSSYSNIRLESYLFTKEAFHDVRRCLKPGGQFVMYNFYRQGWIVNRIHAGLANVFECDPLVLSLPYRDAIQPQDALFNQFTVFMAGDTGRLKECFQKHGAYWLRYDRLPQPELGLPLHGFALLNNGFEQEPLTPAAPGWVRFGPATIVPPAEPQRLATDDWPFLYLRDPMIPDISVRGMATMGGLALLVLLLFRPRTQSTNRSWGLDAHLFLLGAGFMLIETQAVVRMALLFGSTWMVNTFVFFAVLTMILVANLAVLFFQPQRLGWFYAGLLAVLVLNVAVRLDSFLGMPRSLQVLGSCLLVSLPILFAGVIFAVSFGRTVAPERALGANIAGAILGGLAEYTSMLLGFHHLLLVAIALYALSALVLLTVRRSAAIATTMTRQAA
jgi:SAM-dependent methyltransferase